MSKLVNNLMQKGYLRTDVVIDAFSRVHRIEFIPEDLSAYAEIDIPLPIGYGQTISQPLTVATMLELLAPKKGDNVLDVGSGSAWTTALLADMVGEKGSVTALEVIEELCEFGKKNLEKYGLLTSGRVEVFCQSAFKGFEKNAPYDCILVSAGTEELPESLKKQLKIGGKMVIPVHNSLWFVEKRAQNDFYVEKFPGFSFVPFVT
ncbi:MAG: protein-L-isoaspartate O-methyltransferase [Candidatus Moranbacteria bacterium]|nr:protein-L-isoaspartate O-methyltransferase [Candidatus Moranbacteria bacterium]